MRNREAQPFPTESGYTVLDIFSSLHHAYLELHPDAESAPTGLYQLSERARRRAMRRLGSEWRITRDTGKRRGTSLVLDRKHAEEVFDELRSMAREADEAIDMMAVPKNLRELREAGGTSLVEKAIESVFPTEKASGKLPRKGIIFE